MGKGPVWTVTGTMATSTESITSIFPLTVPRLPALELFALLSACQGVTGSVGKRNQYSLGIPLSSARVKTGPSQQTSLLPVLQWPHIPIPHFMRFSRDMMMFS